jgi:ferredoxin
VTRGGARGLVPRRHPPHDAPLVIKKVWIEAGCISCKLCQDIAPQVFLVEDDRDCIVRADAAPLFGPQREDIEQAANDCPVEVIKLEHGA